MPGTTIKDALKMWEKKGEEEVKEGEKPHEKSALDAVELDLQFCWPPIEQMDKTLGTLTKCQKLYLSSNAIDRIQGLQGMVNLKILSLARNSVKTIAGIEAVADSLEELWLSYNHIVSLKGITAMNKLKVLYMNYNSIRDWSEVARLLDMPKVVDVAFIGNPIYDHCSSEDEYRNQMFKKVPHLRRLDGEFRTY